MRTNQTVRFKCHHCLHCCTDVVALPTPWDVVQIVRQTGRHPDEFIEFLTPDEISNVDEDDPTWLICGDERYLMALQRDSKTGCIFLDQYTRACTIYEARPLLCRLFPFRVKETRDGSFRGFALHNDTGCPLHRNGTVAVHDLRALYERDMKHQEDYEDLVKVFNRQTDPDKRPEDFISMFYLKQPVSS